MEIMDEYDEHGQVVERPVQPSDNKQGMENNAVGSDETKTLVPKLGGKPSGLHEATNDQISEFTMPNIVSARIMEQQSVQEGAQPPNLDTEE